MTLVAVVVPDREQIALQNLRRSACARRVISGGSTSCWLPPNPTEEFTGVAVAAAAADALLGDVAVTVAVVGGGGGGGGGAARTAVWTATKADWQTE